MARTICVVTGSRAEYGLLYWTLREIIDDPALELQLVVTGTHLSSAFGLTYQQIEADGFTIAAKVDMAWKKTAISLSAKPWAGLSSALQMRCTS